LNLIALLHGNLDTQHIASSASVYTRIITTIESIEINKLSILFLLKTNISHATIHGMWIALHRSYNIDLCGFPHEEEKILPPHELIQQYQKKRASLNADIDRILADIESILGTNSP